MSFLLYECILILRLGKSFVKRKVSIKSILFEPLEWNPALGPLLVNKLRSHYFGIDSFHARLVCSLHPGGHCQSREIHPVRVEI